MNNQKFPSRAGTVGLGDSYEFLMAAYYGLHLSLNENVTDFKLSTNNNDMGNFDDIVLEITYSDGDEFLYALQLKHCASKDESISLMSFDGDKGKFGLTKYCKGFKSIEEVCSDNPSYTLPFDKFYFILYTNQVLPKFTKNERGKKIEIDELPLTKKSDITIYRHDKCVARNLLSLSDSNSHFIYKFKTDKQDLLDEKFLDHFFLYTGQKEVKDVEYEISRFIRSIFSNCDGDVVTNYLNFFKAWWRGDFGNYKLTKRDIMLKLAEYVLIQHIPDVNFKKLPHYGKKSQLLDDCFKNFDLTVVETVENNEIVDSIWGMVLKRYFKDIEKSWLWSQPLPKVETKFLPEDQKVPISAQGENFIDQSLKKIYTILWHMDILPLVIQVSESHKKGIYAAIKLCEDFEQKKKFIVIDRQFAEDEFNEDLKIFKKLSDVVEFEKFDEIKKEFMVSLQGRQGVTLERLIQLDSRFLEIISTKEFLQMLGDNFCIGDDCKKSLPRHYVTRQTPKILLKTEAIDEIQSDLFVVSFQEFQKPNLKSTTFDMHKYLLMKGGNKQFPDKFVVLVNGLCSEKQFKEISSLNNNRNCHHVRIVNNGTIEWIESQGNISQLRAYMIDVLNFQDDHFVNDLEVLDYFNNRINVINAGPGMGKSIMMKFLKYKCPPNHWVIMINLNDHVKFFKEEHTVNEAVEYLLATESKNLFVKQVVQIFSSRMRILFLWDGFDELPGACVNPVVSLMKKLSVEGYWQWIAARNNSRQFLEDTFNLLSLTMTQFSEQDQQVYIHNHIKERYDDEEKVKRMVLQLNENMSSSLSCGYFDYTGVPLQINMVMEIFLKNPQKYLEEIKIVTLTDIYQEFTDGKFTNLFERASAKSKNYLMQKIQMKFKGAQLPQYEIAALKASFDDKIFNSLNLDCDKFLQEIVQNRDSVGLIFGLNDENKPVFTHKTYEEFLTASWLAKNYKDHPDLVQIIFNEEHNNIRLMFDMILAKDSPVHISILYRNMNILETYGNDVSKYKDKGGRNPLQIACAWGSKHPLGTTFQSNTGETVISINENISEPQLNVEVVNFLLSHGCNPFDKDVLIGWDAVEYADKTLSLSLLEAILAFKHEIDFAKLSNFNDINTLLYYSVKYNYQNLFFRLSDYPYLELSLEGEDMRTLLQFAVQKDRLDFVKLLLNLPHYQNAINKPYKDLGSPLFSAGSNGNIEMFKFLQTKGAQIDRNQSSPLLVAVALGHKAFCRLLLEEKMDVNETFMDGNSVLQIAAMKDHLDVLELLLDYGASVNYVSCLDLTALDYCIDNGCLRGAEILVAKGGKIEFILCNQYFKSLF
jgi:ankyrin repeat protein